MTCAHLQLGLMLCMLGVLQQWMGDGPPLYESHSSKLAMYW